MARNQQHTSLALRTQLQNVHTTLSAGTGSDVGVMTQLPSQLGYLRGHLEREKRTEWVQVCSLAVRLAEALSEGRDLGPDDIFAMIDAIVSDISNGLGVHREPAAAATAAVTEEPRGLTLLSARKLGEIMVQMSMLTHEQVERALNFQRARGCRLGEALVDMGLMKKEAVMSALKIQEMRGGTASRNPSNWNQGAR